jgi:hypothetical protein
MLASERYVKTKRAGKIPAPLDESGPPLAADTQKPKQKDETQRDAEQPQDDQDHGRAPLTG